ncbi:sulfatase [Urbifossiella limnaea]|uniref:Arylsulfatase n=1 Tax=Urbifossiella limnaea TaxID=2528023 RepID=A0A517XU41_9BACT|nr:sulfatase [Urbifossiella limnaea]QDU21033.1 Arylsulfatase [Urbifossiella limnaea]
MTRSLTLAAALTLASATPASAATAAADRLNVVVFLIDDLGWADPGCYGNRFHETPNIDKLAADGVRFTNGYSACTVCSPTRASLLTGQYPARLRVTDWIAGHRRPFAKLRVPDWTMQLPLATHSLAEAFRAAGYVSASVGKWHLGGPGSYPEQHGFDVNIGGTDKGSPPGYFAPERIPTLPPGKAGEFLPDRLAAEAVKFITANKDRPFFVYLPHYAVHTPIGGKPDVIAKYTRKAEAMGVKANPTYAALFEGVDDSVGTVRKALADLKLDGRTIVVFTSDNGGLMPITTNPPFRAGKGSAYEGGVRVPLIVYWPGVTRPGTTSDAPVITCDLYPTLAEACGLRVPAEHPVDGVSFVSHLRGGSPPARDALYWHYPHYHPGGATPYSAARFGDWRLVEFFETGKLELYNLKDDVGERTDLSARDPALTTRLRERLTAWRQSVAAQVPTPNPDYDPARDAPKKKKI